MTAPTPLDTFTRTAYRAANEVIDGYSTSFGTATALLGARHRQHIRNVYALVRVADEIVDGVAQEAGLSLSEQRGALERFRAETDRAVACGYSADVIVHAFACTAKDSGIGTDLTDPFFDSMAMDLEPRAATEHDAYVYGSAQVVGLMCLRVFIRDEEPDARRLEILENGARQLGAALQDINFLRDLRADTDMGRNYLGDGRRLDEAAKSEWVARVRVQLADAEASVPYLPRDARAAVRCAHAVFSRLVDRIDETPVATLYSSRVRVPNAVKAWLAAKSVITTMTERTR